MDGLIELAKVWLWLQIAGMICGTFFAIGMVAFYLRLINQNKSRL